MNSENKSHTIRTFFAVEVDYELRKTLGVIIEFLKHQKHDEHF